MDDLIERLIAALEANTAAHSGGGAATETPKKTAPKKAADKGPSLEDVQNQIRALVAADEGNKTAISAAIQKLGGKRAGDFEDDPKKLTALSEALTAISEAPAEEPEAEDDLL